jgi:hypothetical protein
MLTLLVACAADPMTFAPQTAPAAQAAMLPPFRAWFADADRDGCGDPDSWLRSRTQPPGHVANRRDCLDNGDDAAATFPGAAYLEGGDACETDADGDGFGSMTPAIGVTPGLDCDDSDATVFCVDPLHVGNDVEFRDDSHHLPDYLLGSSIEVPEFMTITALALIGESATAHVKMGLYTDSHGNPDELVVGTDETAVPDGVLEIPVEPTPVTRGTYWLMAVYDTDASVGQEARATPNLIVFRRLDFADPLPLTFGRPVHEPSERFNYYVVGY